ncbi:uncharacterized protein [Musca autumnalis]|uniref:uncharacterized protein n=1 Tax=Musca autumnalis TaxID=221902 RepID=UPI003CE8DE96
MEGGVNLPPPPGKQPPDRQNFRKEKNNEAKMYERKDRSRSRSITRKTDSGKKQKLEEVNNKNVMSVDHEDCQSSPCVNHTSSIDQGASSIASKEGKVNYNNTYDNDHKGPYIAYIDKKVTEGDKSGINGIHVTRLLKSLKVEGVLEVFKIGFGRAKVVFKSGLTANLLLENEELKNQGYIPKIFPHFVSKIGIIFGVPIEISDEELISAIDSEVPILNIVRMTRMCQNERVPTTRVKIFFKGVNLPQSVKFYDYMKTDVKHYISFGQCYNCFRYNHFSQFCKQKIPACKTCFIAHNQNEDCDPEPRCTNCQGNHEPTFKKCPARIKAYQIKKIMTIENLAYREAKAKYSAVFTNRFEIFNENTEEIFPAIKNNKKQNHSNIINNTAEAASFLHSSNSFAKITKNNQNKLREEANARRNMEEYKKALNQEEVHKSPNGVALQSSSRYQSKQQPISYALAQSEQNSQFEKYDKLEKFLESMVQNVDALREKCQKKLEKDELDVLTNIKQKMITEMLNLDVLMVNSSTLSSNIDANVPFGDEEELL